MGELKDILLNFGAIAGFAAIIGLAVLAMLYFSQARDVRRLRDWAGREPERAAEIELRAQQIATQAIAEAYESMAYRQSEADAAAEIAQSDVGEPAGQDTDLAGEVPDRGSEGTEEETSADAAGDAAGEDEPEPVTGEETQSHDVLEEQPESPPAEADAPSVAAASAALGATASMPAPREDEQQPPARITPSTPAAARAAAPLPPLPPLDTSEFDAVRTPSIPDGYLPTGTTGSGTFEALDPPSDHRSRVPFAVAGVLVAIFAVILIATQLLGSDEGQTGTGGSAANRPTRNTADRSQRINRAAVTVSVLNGTTTQGIARAAADGLNKAGFTDTTTGNLSDGTPRPATIVYYAPGSKAEAQEVANELAVKTVKPATDEVLAQGGSVPVVVVLGADFQQ